MLLHLEYHVMHEGTCTTSVTRHYCYSSLTVPTSYSYRLAQLAWRSLAICVLVLTLRLFLFFLFISFPFLFVSFCFHFHFLYFFCFLFSLFYYGFIRSYSCLALFWCVGGFWCSELHRESCSFSLSHAHSSRATSKTSVSTRSLYFTSLFLSL